MKLCFLRHGEADWPNWDKPDDERPLTERGRKEMKRVANFLERLKFSADAILTSPLPRASQTAEIVAKRLGIELKTDPALAHGFNVERLRRLLDKADADCVMVVGHEPAFSEVIKELTGGEIKLSKAGVALLEVNRGCTSGTLLWLFPPKIAKAAL
jgi:phosphohistidine phosphatase